MVVIAAVASALCYSLASVLQQYVAERAPAEKALRFGLLVHLFQRPIWLIGIGCDIGGYGFQWLALRHGSLSLVQPLLLTGFLFALPLGAKLAGRSPTGSETLAALAIVAGLSTSLAAAHPAAGDSTLEGKVALILGLSSAAAILGLIGLAHRRLPGPRAAMLGLAAGIANAMLAVLTRSVSAAISRGVWPLLHHWEVYALIVTAVISLVLVQSAFQAGPLKASLAALTLSEPIAAATVGLAALDERIRLTPLAGALELVGLGLAISGTVVLSRSSAVAMAMGEGVPHPDHLAGHSPVQPAEAGPQPAP